MIQLVAFLGNPGKEYERNRHNAGRMLCHILPFYASLSWQKKFKGLYAGLSGERILAALNEASLNKVAQNEAAAEAEPAPEAQVPDKIHFLIPETFMNCSGESVFSAASFFKIKTNEILVVHDELEMALGVISLKFSGGLGGHNGLRSMKACFGNADFWRLRIGIGRPDSRLPGQGGPQGSGEGVADWVLSDFIDSEQDMLNPALDAAAALVLDTLVRGPETLLPQWAKKRIV